MGFTVFLGLAGWAERVFITFPGPIAPRRKEKKNIKASHLDLLPPPQVRRALFVQPGPDNFLRKCCPTSLTSGSDHVPTSQTGVRQSVQWWKNSEFYWQIYWSNKKLTKLVHFRGTLQSDCRCQALRICTTVARRSQSEQMWVIFMRAVEKRNVELWRLHICQQVIFQSRRYLSVQKSLVYLSG